ncbi:MAG: glycosyltransferase family 9 protein [Candidatus Brocadiia bacterium]
MTICQRKSGGRILCIRLSGMGDVIHALNALTLLRRERPDAHITWAVEERFAGLLRGHPHADEVVAIPRLRWAAMVRSPWRWKRLVGEMHAVWRRLREARFDVSVDFQSSLKSAWLVLAAGAPRRVGFGGPVSRELNHLFQNELVRAPTGGVHRIERDLALLAPLGVRTRYAEPVFPPPGEDGRALAATLQQRLGDGPTVLIHPGTSQFAAFKRWMPARYAQVADRLVEERGADIVVSYGPGEENLAREVVLLMRRPGCLAPPTRTLEELTSLLRRADLFIGSDTGPMHLASALGVPVVALFGPKDPVQTGPYCSRSLVVTGTVPCRPCTRRRCDDVRCMTTITTGRVLDAARRVLDGEGAVRAEDGLRQRPFTWSFRLGRWRGEVNTAYSAPEFFRWLCEAERAAAGDEAAALPAPEGRERWSLQGPGEVDGRLLLERTGSRRCLRRAWRFGTRMSSRGLPVPLPVCMMERPALGGAKQVLVAEQPPHTEPLPAWLTEHWAGAGPEQKERIVARWVAAMRSLHAGGFWHGRLTADNLLACPLESGADPAHCEAIVMGTGKTRKVGWMPPMVVALLLGLEVGRFARSLQDWLSEEETERVLTRYLDAFGGGRYSRRMLERAFRWRKETDSWLTRFL